MTVSKYFGCLRIESGLYTGCSRLAGALDEIAKPPSHFAFSLLDPRLQRREIRRVAGARHHAQQIASCGFRLESFGDAEPQDLREVMIETRRGTQHFGGRLRQHAEPRGV